MHGPLKEHQSRTDGCPYGAATICRCSSAVFDLPSKSMVTKLVYVPDSIE